MYYRMTRRKHTCQSGSYLRGRSFAPRFEPLEDRRLLAAVPLGDELLINEYTRGAQQTVLQSQAIAMLVDLNAVDDDGLDDGAVVTFTGKGPGDSWGVFARRGNLNGLSDTGQFLVNQTTVGAQQNSAVAALPGGGFVIVWEGTGTDYEYGIFARMYNANGAPVSDEFQVNTTSNGAQLFPSVASMHDLGESLGDDLEDSRFVVTWVGKGVGDHWGVHARVFDVDGTAQGNEFLVNETTNGTQHEPHVAMARDGDFVITWAGKGRGDSWGVFARTFGHNGNPNSPEIRVNQMTLGSQLEPAVAIIDHGLSDDSDSNFFDDGAFVVTWTGYGEDDVFGTYASVFDADGSRPLDDFLVNQTTHGDQRWSSVARLREGGFVVSWTGNGEGDYWGTFVREFAADGLPLSSERQVNTTTNGAQQFSSVAADLDGNYAVVWSGYGRSDPAGVYGRAFAELRLDDGATDDGSTDDGSTGDGPTDDGSTGDGSTGDGSAVLASLVADEGLGNLHDINGDGAVSPSDVIAVIQNLGRSPGASNDLLPDVTGDGHVSPADVLAVVQELDRLNSVSGGAEAMNPPLVDASFDVSPPASSASTLSRADELWESGDLDTFDSAPTIPDAEALPRNSTARTAEIATDEWVSLGAIALEDAVVEAVARGVVVA